VQRGAESAVRGRDRWHQDCCLWHCGDAVVIVVLAGRARTGQAETMMDAVGVVAVVRSFLED
jgi:uncharacterized protein CbrC (UPF0167 family)